MIELVHAYQGGEPLARFRFYFNMKIKGFFILPGLALFLAGCGKNIKAGPGIGLVAPDPYSSIAERISDGHKYLSNNKVAVLPFSYTDKHASDDGTVISERLLTRIINRRDLQVIERNLLEKVLAELKLQRSGAIDESSIKGIGKILGVEAIVTGTLTRRKDGRIEINARLIKTETAAVIAAAAEPVVPDWETAGPFAPEVRKQPVAPAPLISAKPPPPVHRTGCPAGMTVYWNFDESEGSTAYDSFGINDGTLIGGPVRDPAGKAGGALRFDGANDYIFIPDAPGLNPPNEITASAWVYIYRYKTAPLSNNIIVKDDFDSQKRDYILQVGYFGAGDTAQFTVFTTAGPGEATGGSVGLAAWHHIAGTYDGHMIKLYVDGALAAAKSHDLPEGGTLRNTDTPVRLGGTNELAYNRFFNGLIDEVQIYDRALSASEIATRYREGAAGKPACKFTVPAR